MIFWAKSLGLQNHMARSYSRSPASFPNMSTQNSLSFCISASSQLQGRTGLLTRGTIGEKSLGAVTQRLLLFVEGKIHLKSPVS